jgi:hypothetical protein
MSRTHPQQRVQKKSDKSMEKKDFSKDLSNLFEPNKPVKFSREDAVVKKEKVSKKEMVELNVEVPEKQEEPKQIKKKK